MTEAKGMREVPHLFPLSSFIGLRAESKVFSLKADASVTLKERERIANAQICKFWCYEIETGAIFRLMIL